MTTSPLSDYLARRATAAEGSLTLSALNKATGLHDSMYLVTILGTLLVLVLLAASRTVTRDHENLQEWMETAAHA